MPPEFKIGSPESRRVVELKQPPTADGNNRDGQKLKAIVHQKRSTVESVNQRVNKEYVSRPDDRRHPVTDKLIATEEQCFSRNDAGETDVAIQGKLVSVHAAFRNGAG